MMTSAVRASLVASTVVVDVVQLSRGGGGGGLIVPGPVGISPAATGNERTNIRAKHEKRFLI